MVSICVLKGRNEGRQPMSSAKNLDGRVWESLRTLTIQKSDDFFRFLESLGVPKNHLSLFFFNFENFGKKLFENNLFETYHGGGSLKGFIFYLIKKYP